MFQVVSFHTYYIIVYCADGAISLMEGVGEWEGRLEVCYVGRWGTVSADEWTETNSRVVCNSLGYEISGEITFPRSNNM